MNKIKQAKQVVKDIKSMMKVFKKIVAHFKDHKTLKREAFNNFLEEENLYREED